MKFFKLILFFGTLFFCGLFFFNKQRQFVVKNEQCLIVGTSPDYPPYEFVDVATGEIVGFDIDIATEVALRLDKKIIIQAMPFVSLIFELLSGDIDMIASGMSPTPRRSKFVLFSEKYWDNDAYVIMTIKDKFVPTSLKDLDDKDVVVNTGYAAEAYLDQENVGARLMRLRTPAEALVALFSNSADAFFCAYSTAQSIVSRVGNVDKFYFLILENTGDDYAFAFNKQSVALTANVNEALASMRVDGTLDLLKEKWKLS